MDREMQEVIELLDTIGDTLPKILKALRESIFSAEAGKEIGDSIGNFYKALIEKGVPEDRAMELALEYMKTIRVIGNKMDISKDALRS